MKSTENFEFMIYDILYLISDLEIGSLFQGPTLAQY